MTSINDVRLVGRLTKSPEFHETAAKKKYARLSVETENYKRVNGERRRIAYTHTVICYNQFSLPVLQGVKAGQRVKVYGELGYDRAGKAVVQVHQYTGEVGLMDIPDQHAPQASQAPAAKADESFNTKARPSGGLGHLPQSRPDPDPAPNPAASSPDYDDETDSIPF